jgi:hypothetical protein
MQCQAGPYAVSNSCKMEVHSVITCIHHGKFVLYSCWVILYQITRLKNQLICTTNVLEHIIMCRLHGWRYRTQIYFIQLAYRLHETNSQSNGYYYQAIIKEIHRYNKLAHSYLFLSFLCLTILSKNIQWGKFDMPGVTRTNRNCQCALISAFVL